MNLNLYKLSQVFNDGEEDFESWQVIVRAANGNEAKLLAGKEWYEAEVTMIGWATGECKAEVL